MIEIDIEWTEFVERYKRQEIKAFVETSKGQALMTGKFAPSHWRVSLNIMLIITLLSFPLAIVLFFFIKWWIPILIIIAAFVFLKSIREEAAKAVIEESLKDPDFYGIARITSTLIIYDKA